MASTTFPSVPPILKPLQSFMKIASDFDKLDAVIAYWVRFYVVQNGLKIDSKSKESIGFLTAIMGWLEKACNHTFSSLDFSHFHILLFAYRRKS